MRRTIVIALASATALLAAALGLRLLFSTKVHLATTASRGVAESHSKNASSNLASASAKDLAVGALAPDFKLKRIDGLEMHLASFRGQRPVVLIFASYTCDIFEKFHAIIEMVHDRNKARAEFIFVYIREAHPSDSSFSFGGGVSGVSVEAPKNYNQRWALASTACSKMQINLPCVIDEMDDVVDKAYSAWPLRIVVVDTFGKIAVLSSRNPNSFAATLGDVSQWLTKQER